MPVAAETSKPAKTDKPKLNWYPLWAPRFWHGMGFRDYVGMLARNVLREDRLYDREVHPNDTVFIHMTCDSWLPAWCRYGTVGSSGATSETPIDALVAKGM